MPSPTIWLITGTSTGLGRALTELVLAKGQIVVATARRTGPLHDLKVKYPADRLLVLKLDVTNSDEITEAFAQVKAAFGRLDVVVNNAAWGTFGEVESAREADARAMFDTNFWGAANVLRAAVAFFREVNAQGDGGRLIQISSIGGFIGLPGLGYHSASKSALEGLTESIAGEIDPTWNINFTLIHLGSFATEGVQKILWSPTHPAYDKLPVHAMRSGWKSFVPSGDVKKAVEVLYAIAGLPEPPMYVPFGKDALESVKKKLVNVAADLERYEYLLQELNEG